MVIFADLSVFRELFEIYARESKVNRTNSMSPTSFSNSPPMFIEFSIYICDVIR